MSSHLRLSQATPTKVTDFGQYMIAPKCAQHGDNSVRFSPWKILCACSSSRMKEHVAQILRQTTYSASVIQYRTLKQTHLGVFQKLPGKRSLHSIYISFCMYRGSQIENDNFGKEMMEELHPTWKSSVRHLFGTNV